MSVDGSARHVTAAGADATRLADDLARQLDGNDLRLAIVFADWRVDPQVLAGVLRQALAGAPVVGCSTLGIVPNREHGASALGLYGDWLRVGIGVAPELAKSPLPRSRDAVVRAASSLSIAPEALDAQRHVAITLFDGTSEHAEAFCIGSAATAPQIRFVGGGGSAEIAPGRRTHVWAHGEAMVDAGVVVLLETQRPFEVVTSSHLVPTDVRTVVTSSSGRVVDELDGKPAAHRLAELLATIDADLDPSRPTGYSFARYVDGVPYVRSMTRIDGTRIYFPSGVEVGHVLHVMLPGDLIAVTRRDLASAAARVGGSVEALIAFSCAVRHWEAAVHGLDRDLASVYAAYPTTGCQSFGEQTGILLVNHTLTALAIGGAR